MLLLLGIITAAAIFVAYMLNKSNKPEIKIEAPEKIEPIEEPVKEVKATKTKTTKPATQAAKKSKVK